jgi:hypothetical protein
MSKPEEREWFVVYKVESYGKLKVKGGTRAEIAAEVSKMDLKELATDGNVHKVKIIGITKGNTFRNWK